jgi:hypothetical protein
MDIDLKTLAPDNTIPAGAVLFGADSQAAAQPSVYLLSDVVALAPAVTAAAANNFTADQTITKATPVLRLNKAASGQFASYRGSTNGALRWDMPLGNDTAETGSNAGSDFEIASYNDAGTGRAVRMRIRRSDGAANLFGNVEIGTLDANNNLRVRRRASASGAQLLLEPQNASGLSGDMSFAAIGTSAIIQEGAGSFRGAFLDLTQCAINGGSALVHSGNIGAQIAAIAHTAVGAYGLFSISTALATGGTTAGSNLTYAVSGGAGAGNPSGVWRNHSAQPIGTQVIICQRTL